MSVAHEQVISGLEGVLACETGITLIDGERGVLLYRGFDIHEIAEALPFEETVFLLWYGRLPSAEEAAAFRGDLAAERRLPADVLRLLASLPREAHPMAALRAAVSLLAALDPLQEETGQEANFRKAKSLLAKFPTITAALCRLQQGREPVDPDPQLDLAENYLYMLTGERPDEDRTRALHTALNLYADHELNASTFACRVVVGTLADLYSAVVAGLCALKGPLHGGAIDDVMRTLMTIGSVERVPDYVEEALAAKRKIPGFGHRVYRTEDPRAVHLKRMAERLAESHGMRTWYEISVRMEEYVRGRKGLRANVDYYAASVLWYLGFPLNLYTNFIASSRIAGWVAHALEQYANNRLIRPRALYRGPHGLHLEGRC